VSRTLDVTRPGNIRPSLPSDRLNGARSAQQTFELAFAAGTLDLGRTWVGLMTTASTGPFDELARA
jgi:hypothetical protein